MQKFTKDFQPKVDQLIRRQINCSEDLFPFISHCFFLFPLGYEFTRQELAMLWLVEGLIWPSSTQFDRDLDFAYRIFDSLLSQNVIILSQYDIFTDFVHPMDGKILYKVNDSSSFPSSFRPALLNDRYATISNNDFSHVPETILHLAVIYEHANQINFDTISKFTHLHTLFIIPSFSGFHIEKIPYYLFKHLKHLRSLDLSGSRVSELPCSIGNLKLLMFINLSCTPIKCLPDSIDNLHNLQTLKLRLCLNLFELPRGTSKLTNLRHLDLDIRQLTDMPPRMGNLTNLEALSAFHVSKYDGMRIVELKNMTKLAGRFCITRLENVSSFEEAKDAALINKRFLKKLELSWKGNMKINNEKAKKEEKILEYLQPPFGIEDLKILYYCGFKLPSWISNSSYDALVDITLVGCRNCEFLPSIGELPSLKILDIIDMYNLKRIDNRLCRKDRKALSQAFPRLEKLSINGMSKLEEWIGLQNGDFPVLHTLTLELCPELKTLSVLSYLSCLQHLELSYCQNLLFLPDQVFPSSIEYFWIIHCPLLKEQFQKKERQDWEKIAHIPNIFVDYVPVSWKSKYA